MTNSKKRGLGRGLSALLENTETDVTSNFASPDNPKVVGSISKIPIEQIETNPFQPRTTFEENYIEELAESIKQHGVIQPITVRKLGYEKYQLISGERRLRASKIAGLSEIPAYIRIADDQEMLELALVENIQRRDLDAIEVAISFQRLIEECKLTQEELSKKVGKDRTTVTNYLRLLKLPSAIQLAIKKRLITMGHARAILSVNDPDKQIEILKNILENNLSVRKVEELVAQTKKTAKTQSKPSNSAYQQIEKELQNKLHRKVKISGSANGKGKITFTFNSEADLQELINKIL
ncbi:MAG: ParB/RepB/Spo0J family partition protein [Bacteroidetes bacterium]|nr:MAG: ParB/RepB/Spo0J family partition protein [Bacteroidota bacterium]